MSPKPVASGRHKINTGETVLYSEREDDQHHQGVVIIFKKGLEKCLIEWKPINSRLIKVRLKVRHINTTIIQCHTPTKDSEEDKRKPTNSFKQRHGMKIVMGDLNAKVENDNRNYERAMEREGCGSMNDNGKRLLDICTAYDFSLGGPLFLHRNVHKLT